jgi:hypothetical protein
MLGQQEKHYLALVIAIFTIRRTPNRRKSAQACIDELHVRKKPPIRQKSRLKSRLEHGPNSAFSSRRVPALHSVK